jgi:hypothetical protein
MLRRATSMGISHSVSSVSSVLPALSFFKPAPATPTVSSFDILARAPFHASAVLHRDVGGMNSRGRATPKAATEKVKKASAEKSSDEKDQRAQERAERDVRLKHLFLCPCNPKRISRALPHIASSHVSHAHFISCHAFRLPE